MTATPDEAVDALIDMLSLNTTEVIMRALQENPAAIEGAYIVGQVTRLMCTVMRSDECTLNAHFEPEQRDHMLLCYIAETVRRVTRDAGTLMPFERVEAIDARVNAAIRAQDATLPWAK